jgi:hypothetical protein
MSDLAWHDRRLVVAGALLAALALGFGLGRVDTGGGVEVPPYREFDAVVDSIEPDGLRGCLSPVDPALLQRLGPVCGRLFQAAGLSVSPARRVHVEWFAVVTRDEGEAVDAMVLSPVE